MNCFECGEPFAVEHHVVPKSRGGKKTVPLCARCHALIHADSGNVLYGGKLRRGRGRAPHIRDIKFWLYLEKLKGTMTARQAEKSINFQTCYQQINEFWHGRGSAARWLSELRAALRL